MRIAPRVQSEIESVFVEDEQLFDCAAYGFVREVSLTGRARRALSAADVIRATCIWRLRARGGSWRRWRGKPRCRCARAWCATSRAGACRSPVPSRPLERGGARRTVQRRQLRAAEAASDRGVRRHRPGHRWARRLARLSGPAIVAVEDTASLPAMLRAAERLARSMVRTIVLLLIAADEEELSRMDGEARLVVEAREDVRIEWAADGARRGRCDCGGAAAAAGRVPDLPVRRPGGARRGRPCGRSPACWSARCCWSSSAGIRSFRRAAHRRIPAPSPRCCDRGVPLPSRPCLDSRARPAPRASLPVACAACRWRG